MEDNLIAEKKPSRSQDSVKSEGESSQSPPVYTDLNESTSTKFVLNPFASKLQVMKDSLSQYCSQCNLYFKNNAEYMQHSKDVHNSDKKVFSCDICQTDFTRRAHLIRHIHCQHPNPMYCHCPVCFKSFKIQDKLKEHIKAKHSEKNDTFHCRVCTYQCNNLKDLRTHEINHTISERHHCTECNMTFKRRDHMLRHVKSQHLKQSVQCPICKQIYKRSDHVARHMRDKHHILDFKAVNAADYLVEEHVYN